MNNKTNPSFDDLLDAWQRQSDHIDMVAREHPVTLAELYTNVRCPSHPWPHLVQLLFSVAVGLAGLVVLAGLYRHRVVDVWDLVPHLLVGILLVFVVADGLRRIIGNLRCRLSLAPSRAFVQTAAGVAVVALFLISATPAYDGRSMKVHQKSDRSLLLASTDGVIEKVINTSL